MSRGESYTLERPEAGWRTETLLEREWLVTNGLGGYASSTLGWENTRTYHGLLIAAHEAPLSRVLMLKQLAEQVQVRGSRVTLSGALESVVREEPPSFEHLREFRLVLGLPQWRYQIGDVWLDKQVYMPHGQNSVYAHYRLDSGAEAVTLRLRPWVHFRSHDNPVRGQPARQYALQVYGNRYEIVAGADFPALRMLFYGDTARFIVDGGLRREIFLPIEAERGYEARRVLWSPGYFEVVLAPGNEACLVASTEAWNAVIALKPYEALQYEQDRRTRLQSLSDPCIQRSPLAPLILAADQFLFVPAGRVRDALRANAFGDQVRSIIAGYHWFADWGRDTMISLEGLALTTGRHLEAGWILRTFQHYVRDGLLPNMFPEGEEEGRYNTADATLWYFHALDRYLAYAGDRDTLRLLLPTLLDVVHQHLTGTRFGIHVDEDGLVTQGAEGYALTWMDAKVDDWVVTPRRGKAVEINALWYNALCLLAGWLREEERAGEADEIDAHARRARHAFNERFWCTEGGYLYDVVDGEQGEDRAFRPNQLFAFSLRHPVLAREQWRPVLEQVEQRLLTPVGLRSLAPDHPAYRPHYFGDLRARDAAYHQGTVWAWLIGPYVDAHLAVHPDDRAGARRLLEGFLPHLGDACVGSVSEIFDAEPPFTPRGCISQAWSVAELLRAWRLTDESARSGA